MDLLPRANGPQRWDTCVAGVVDGTALIPKNRVMHRHCLLHSNNSQCKGTRMKGRRNGWAVRRITTTRRRLRRKKRKCWMFRRQREQNQGQSHRSSPFFFVCSISHIIASINSIIARQDIVLEAVHETTSKGNGTRVGVCGCALNNVPMSEVLFVHGPPFEFEHAS